MSDPNQYAARLAHFRAEIDEMLGMHPQSPLDPLQQEVFEGLDYYDADASYRFTGEVERFGDDEPLVEMQTSTGDTRYYRRWGRFTFEVDGEETSVVIYQDPTYGDFFLPFKDATNGAETYGAGRYLDNHRPGLRPLGDNRIEIDFNYAYNPYCAYNEDYSCPLPPRENWLKVPIRAGEKQFKQADH
ncbi:MAG: DUF1684 domain-containing protein [Chloroflexi bacterium]|jgi:uncharacterized protein (DUF1684 family)|nr:DUF1684 domain-containing protein [Chloroflexota bacterium]